ncbi:MAG: hypothetical protein ACTTJO_00815 [Metamycoplasmataceae bacterium]
MKIKKKFHKKIFWLGTIFLPIILNNLSISCGNGFTKEEENKSKEFLNEYSKIEKNIISSYNGFKDLMNEKIYKKYYFDSYEKIENLSKEIQKQNIFDDINKMINLEENDYKKFSFFTIKKNNKEKILDTNIINKLFNFLSYFEKLNPNGDNLIDKELVRLFNLNDELNKIFYDYSSQIDTEKSSLYNLNKIALFSDNNEWKEANDGANNPSFSNIKNKTKRDQLRNNFFSNLLDEIKNFYNGKNDKNDEFSFKYWNENLKDIDYSNLYDENNGKHVHAILNLFNEWKSIVSDSKNSKFNKVNDFLNKFRDLFKNNDEEILVHNSKDQEVINLTKWFNKFKNIFKDFDTSKLEIFQKEVLNNFETYNLNFLKVLNNLKDFYLKLKSLVNEY